MDEHFNEELDQLKPNRRGACIGRTKVVPWSFQTVGRDIIFRMEVRREKLWKVLSFAMCGAGMLIGLFAWSIEYQYIETLPRRADPSVGRVYPYNYHGIVLWRSREEERHVDSLEYVSGFLFLGGALIAVLKCKVPLIADRSSPMDLPSEFSPRLQDRA